MSVRITRDNDEQTIFVPKMHFFLDKMYKLFILDVQTWMMWYQREKIIC